MIIFRVALTILAFAMIGFGIVVTVAPTPFGFILVVLGFLLLASVAPAFVRGLRKHWGWLDRRLTDLQKRSPGWIAKILRRTVPDENKEEKRPEKGQ